MSRRSRAQARVLADLAAGGEIVQRFDQLPQVPPWWLFMPGQTRKQYALTWNDLWQLVDAGWVQAKPGTIGTVYMGTAAGQRALAALQEAQS